MNVDKYLDELTNYQEKEFELAASKTSDYGKDEDTFSLIKKVAKDAGITPAQVVYIYLSKHLIAINQAIQKNPHNPTCEAEDFDQRIKDARAYLLMLILLNQDYKLSSTVCTSSPEIKNTCKVEDKGMTYQHTFMGEKVNPRYCVTNFPMSSNQEKVQGRNEKAV